MAGRRGWDKLPLAREFPPSFDTIELKLKTSLCNDSDWLLFGLFVSLCSNRVTFFL